jgi:hypothetical protein
MFAGATSSEIPDQLRARIAEGPGPLRLVARYLDIRALASRGAWAEAAAAASSVEEDIAKLDPKLQKQLDNLLVAIRLELRFARGMEGIDLGPRPEGMDINDIEWNSPGFLARIEAIEALQTGDETQVRRKLAESEAKVARGVSLGHVREEAMYRAAILARLPAA